MGEVAVMERIQEILKGYDSLEGAKAFFSYLGYPVMEPLRWDLELLPSGAKKAIASVHQLVQVGDGFPFRVFHVEIDRERVLRTDIRRFLEAFYRHYPVGENLFVFLPTSQSDKLLFVSPKRLPDPRDPGKVRLWLRILQVERERPFRTDLEVLSRIQADGVLDPQKIWELHEEAFSIQRVTEQFFKDYSEIFHRIQGYLKSTHRGNGPEWARDYTHQLLNRIMFLYFIARKGWLLGPDRHPDRDFIRHFWEAYRESGNKDKFHSEWLPVLFFEAFNGRWTNRPEYRKRFPAWLISSLAQAPFLNGGLYSRRPGLDDRLNAPLPDEFFELLFERWIDGTFPGLFERYNFTVVESGRFDEEVAVDPQMLGMVYERLVNVTFESGEEDLRGAAGIFYTPRTEIDLMCRLALVDWLGNQLGQDYKELLYRWVFAFSEEEKRDADDAITQEALWERLNELVKRARVCDPACGSGSFLVGMMLVLDDLQARCNKALGHEESPYKRRKRILQDQLYGVDVMEWAVRVAELRLWLQLIVETELHPAELHFKPLLPNLNFKIRPGDSLLQTLGDLDLSPFRRSELSIPRYLKGRLTKLKGKKRLFFQGETSGLSEADLKREELNLFRDILYAKIHELENELKEKAQALATQEGFVGMDAPSLPERSRAEEEIRVLKERLAHFKKTYETLKPDQPPPFVWDIAFVEIFEDANPGFDIVIGNPPYVRQEKIRDYLGRFDRKEYIERLNQSLRAIYSAFMGKRRKIAGRADYYVYFYLHGLSLLADRGTFCFITSNSWLDVDFGRDLQDFFLRFGHLKLVIDNRAKRSFSQADVNTVIVLAGPPKRKRALSEREMKKRKVRFVAFRVPFEEALSPTPFLEIENEELYEPTAGFRVLRRPEFRAVLWDQSALYREGSEGSGKKLAETGEYKGDKWGGKYLRAPDIFFTILKKGKGKLVRLGDIAEVRFGIKTGANDFFYLEPTGQPAPKGLVHVRNGVGWEGYLEEEFLKPIIKSPREIKTIIVRPEDLRYRVFMCHKSKDELRREGKTHALAYIEWGEEQGYHLRPTCRSRPRWWDLGERGPGLVIWPMIHYDRLSVAVRDSMVQVDHNLFDIQTDLPIGTCGLLHWTGQILIRELFGRVNLGEGALKTEGIDIAKFLVLNPSLFIPSQRERLEKAFGRMSKRQIKSIFEELGLPRPNRDYSNIHPEDVSLDKVLPDRRALDEVVFEALGLTEEEQLAVYRAVVELVKDRLVKARSV